jgi:hypothetical protein
MSDQDLKACPFCGGKAELVTGAPEYWVRCMACKVGGDTTSDSGRAVAKWNARSPEPLGQEAALSVPVERETIARLIDPAAWSMSPSAWVSNGEAMLQAARGPSLDKADAILSLLAAPSVKDMGDRASALIEGFAKDENREGRSPLVSVKNLITWLKIREVAPNLQSILQGALDEYWKLERDRTAILDEYKRLYPEDGATAEFNSFQRNRP